MSSPQPELQQLASEATLASGTTLDPETAPLILEEGQLSVIDPGPGGPANPITREYVWGTGDGGVDELLCQSGPNGVLAFALLDASGDVVAMAPRDTVAGARLVWQGAYDAYGGVLLAHLIEPGAPPQAYPDCGHKGLFFDNLDQGVTAPVGVTDNPRLKPGHRGMYYVRNRTYAPHLGRFLQRDPNATAQHATTQAWHGSAPSPDMPALTVANADDGSTLVPLVDAMPRVRGQLGAPRRKPIGVAANKA
jgi:hypothetical protein